MNVILHTHAVAVEFEVHANRFFKQYIAQETKLEFGQALAIVTAIVDDALNERMAWTSGFAKTHEDMLKRVFAWFDIPENEEIADQFYCDIFDGILTLTYGMIDEIVPYDTWDVWDVRKLGTDLLLSKGRDYRVLEWERITGYHEKTTRIRIMTPSRLTPEDMKRPPMIVGRRFTMLAANEEPVPTQLFEDLHEAGPKNVSV